MDTRPDPNMPAHFLMIKRRSDVGYMRLRLQRIVFVTCLVVTSAGAKESDMVMSYKIKMDNQEFSISSPLLPDNEFFTHRPSIPLHDDTLFGKSNRIIGLKMQWTYKTGLLGKVAGEVEMKVMLQASREYDVTSDDGLKQQLLSDFKRELSKVGYDGSPVQFDKVTVNGYSWLKYNLPILGILEYSSGVSDKRFLTVRFVFTDNTGEASPLWRQRANDLMRELVASMKITENDTGQSVR